MIKRRALDDHSFKDSKIQRFKDLKIQSLMFRKLTAQEIAQLEAQGCKASNWAEVEVAEDFDARFVRHANFSGHNIRLLSWLDRHQWCLRESSVCPA